MASNLETLVTVFGGSGFLGRNVVRALAKREYRIRVAVRRPELAGHLQPLGRVGQIHAVAPICAIQPAEAMRIFAAINRSAFWPRAAQTFDATGQGRGSRQGRRRRWR
jgi:NADH dehydrogenase